MLHPDRIASGNGKWPPPPKPQATPLNWAWSTGWVDQVGGGFLWTRSFTYRKRERKLRIKLFDRYFSSFSQRVLFFGFVSFIVVVYMEQQQRCSSPLKSKLMWVC